LKLNKDAFLKILKFVWVIAVVVGGVYYVIKNYAQAIQYLDSMLTFLAWFSILLPYNNTL